MRIQLVNFNSIIPHESIDLVPFVCHVKGQKLCQLSIADCAAWLGPKPEGCDARCQRGDNEMRLNWTEAAKKLSSQCDLKQLSSFPWQLLRLLCNCFSPLSLPSCVFCCCDLSGRNVAQLSEQVGAAQTKLACLEFIYCQLSGLWSPIPPSSFSYCPSSDFDCSFVCCAGPLKKLWQRPCWLCCRRNRSPF